MKTIMLVLGLAIGYLTGSYVFSTIFDPMQFLQNANVTAANAYLYGCAAAKGEHDFCMKGAKELYEKLEELRVSAPVKR